MPLYGRTFSLRDATKTDVGASHNGPGIAGVYTNEPGFMGYNEVKMTVVIRSDFYNRKVKCFKDLRKEIVRTLVKNLGTPTTSAVFGFEQKLDQLRRQ